MKCNYLNKSVETNTQTASNYRESLHELILGNLCLSQCNVCSHVSGSLSERGIVTINGYRCLYSYVSKLPWLRYLFLA